MSDASGVFPLMSWNFLMWNPELDVPRLLRGMRDCGLNVGGFVRPEQLDACRDAGLKALVYDERFSTHDWRKPDAASMRRKISEAIAQVRDHPAVCGYYLKDEPSADEFEGLAIAADVVKELHPGVWPYINLFPNYATREQLGCETYEEHLERFVKTCRPPIISYDHYALMEDGTNREGYFTNLEQIRAASARHGIPFHNIVQSVALLVHREPTAADYRYQAFTTLAYGGSGITYFTYFTPPVGNFRGAPLDQFGNATAAWQPLQNVNLQVQKLAPTLLQLRHRGAYHFGAVPPGCNAPTETSLVKSAQGEFVVGDFEHADGTPYVMLVNPDTNRSTACNPVFRTPPARTMMISLTTGKPVPYEGEQCWLAPGGGVLLMLA